MARRATLPSPPYDWPGRGLASMQAGVLLLALNRRDLYPLLQRRREQLQQVARQSGDLSQTPYGAVNSVINGIWDLINYLTYGRRDLLGRSAAAFQTAMANTAAADDVDSRWVAAHLVNLSQDLGSASVWSVLPPDQPAAARAMTLGDPPVLLLWPPQLSFLTPGDDGNSPLQSSAKRIVLSFPTSAGKSLLAQLLVVSQLITSTSDICVVAPTHSLCRELTTALQGRLRTLGQQLHEDGPLGVN